MSYFVQRDGVELDNKCLTYKCVEEVKNGQLAHHWEVVSNKDEECRNNPDNLCDVSRCDTATGQCTHETKSCVLSQEFPTLTESQAECFYCKCSFTDGNPVLSMMDETNEKRFDLDGCGNCRVFNRTTGEQINDKKECILSAEVNNAGAIAAATTVAAVVVALVVAMVVVSIGLFQAYRLVSSALKNAVTTTTANAEYVEAENEATNAATYNG